MTDENNKIEMYFYDLAFMVPDAITFFSEYLRRARLAYISAHSTPQNRLTSKDVRALIETQYGAPISKNTYDDWFRESFNSLPVKCWDEIKTVLGVSEVDFMRSYIAQCDIARIKGNDAAGSGIDLAKTVDNWQNALISIYDVTGSAAKNGGSLDGSALELFNEINDFVRFKLSRALKSEYRKYVISISDDLMRKKYVIKEFDFTKLLTDEHIAQYGRMLEQNKRFSLYHMAFCDVLDNMPVDVQAHEIVRMLNECNTRIVSNLAALGRRLAVGVPEFDMFMRLYSDTINDDIERLKSTLADSGQSVKTVLNDWRPIDLYDLYNIAHDTL